MSPSKTSTGVTKKSLKITIPKCSLQWEIFLSLASMSSPFCSWQSKTNGRNKYLSNFLPCNKRHLYFQQTLHRVTHIFCNYITHILEFYFVSQSFILFYCKNILLIKTIVQCHASLLYINVSEPHYIETKHN